MQKPDFMSLIARPTVKLTTAMAIFSIISTTSSKAGSASMSDANSTTTIAAEAQSSSELKSPPAADKIPEGAEKDAWLLLKAAHDARQVMPPDFNGFDANVTFTEDDTKYSGTMTYRKSTGTKIDVAGVKGEPLDWLQDKLASFIGHRRGDNFSDGDGKNPITFGAEDKSPYGRLVELHDRMNSKYRIKNNMVREVTRTTPESTFTISVIETMEADPGKYLSKNFIVSYRNLVDKNLEQVDGFNDHYDKVDDVWLPHKRVVLTVTKENESPRTRTIELTDIKVVKN
jgi:hypothetical protein